MNTTVGVLIVAVAALAAVVAIVWRLWRATLRSPRSYLRRRAASRRERGYRALTHGMVAVAAGDAEEAKRQARRAGALLDEPPLTLLLSAQAAQLDGDETAARRYFGAMMERDETSFLGLRGLLMQALRRGDDAAALELAQRARAERPETPWVVQTLLDLQVKRGAWTEALPTLAEASRLGLVESEAARRQRAALLVEEARRLGSGGDRDGALAKAREAHKLDPAFVPAAAEFAALLISAGRIRKATRTIESTWTHAPHPALARAYAALAPGEPPIERARRFERLASLNSATPEAHIALAETAIKARLFGEARRHLEAAIAERPFARAYRLMAELEEADQGDSEAATRWLRRAAEAPADPAWICGRCGAARGQWHARCEACGAFATLVWREPERSEPLAVPSAPERPRLEEPAAAAAPAPDSVVAARLVT